MTKEEYDNKKLWEKYPKDDIHSLIRKIAEKTEELQELIFAIKDRGEFR